MKPFDALRIIDDAGLDPYERAIVTHVWRVGISWETTRTLKDQLRMGLATVSRTMNKLKDKGILETAIKDGRVGVRVSFITLENCCIRSTQEQERSTQEQERSTQEQERSTQERHLKKASLSKPNEVRPLEEEGADPAAAATTAYSNEIGELTKIIGDRIADWVDDTPAGWVVDAIGEAAIYNKRNWGYVEAILKRWKAEGRGKARASPNGSHPQKKPAHEYPPVAGEF